MSAKKEKQIAVLLWAKTIPSMVAVTLSLAFFPLQDGSAQNSCSSSKASVQVQTSIPTPIKLRYDVPKTSSVGTKQSMLLSDFKCGADGSIFLPIVEDTANIGHFGGAQQGIGSGLMIVELTPSGNAVHFKPQEINGYRNFVSLLRYYVSSSRVYILTMADKIDSTDATRTVGRSRFIQVFNYEGELTQSILLPPGTDPENLAAFESGEILILSVDKLNQTTRLLLFDSAGHSDSELKLFDSDFGPQLNSTDKSKSGFYSSRDGGALSKLLAVANIVPYGENLLLAASQVNLPVLELNQHGVVREIKLALPLGATIQSILPSDNRSVHALVGNFPSLPSSGTASVDEPPSNETRALLPTEIDVFYPQDGSISTRISITPGPMPVCALGDAYTFLAPREEDGKLQLIRATPIR